MVRFFIFLFFENHPFSLPEGTMKESEGKYSIECKRLELLTTPMMFFLYTASGSQKLTNKLEKPRNGLNVTHEVVAVG